MCLYSSEFLATRQAKIERGDMCPLVIANDDVNKKKCPHQQWHICTIDFAIYNCPIFTGSLISACYDETNGYGDIVLTKIGKVTVPTKIINLIIDSGKLPTKKVISVRQ